jgi:hypothetical protein
MWVYLVWFFLQRTLEVMASPPRGGAWEWWLPLTPWIPHGHFWFLPFLALATVAVVSCRPWERTWALVALLAAGLLFWGWTPPVLGLDGIANVAFLAAGASWGKDRTVGFMTRHPRALVGVGAAAAGAFIVVWSCHLVGPRSGEMVGPAQRTLSMIAAFLGVPILAALGIVLSAVPVLGRAVAWHLGRGSVTIAIFATHVMAIVGVRTLLKLAGVPESSAAIYWVMCVAGGLTLPLLLRRASRAVGAPWLFEAPVRRRPRGASG